jgi:hypothetical protein
MGFWEDIKRAGSALNDAVDSATGDNYFKWACPRCGYKVYACPVSWPKKSMAEHLYKDMCVIRCESPVLGLGCGFLFGVDPFRVYCRCTCGHLTSYARGEFIGHWICECGKPYTIQRFDDPLVHFSCGVPNHNHVYSVPRNFDQERLETDCKTFSIGEVANLALPNFVDRLETAVLSIVFEKQIQQAQMERLREIGHLADFRLSGIRRASYRRVVVTNEGVLAEEIVLES